MPAISMGAAISIIKGLQDTAKAMIKAHDEGIRKGLVAEFNEKLIDLQNAHFEVMSERSELSDEVTSLKKSMAKLQSWEAEKTRYRLTALAPEVFAYVLKDEAANGEPQHLLCANCLTAGKKSFLQQESHNPTYAQYRCGGCEETLAFSRGGARRPMRAEMDYDPFDQ